MRAYPKFYLSLVYKGIEVIGNGMEYTRQRHEKDEVLNNPYAHN